MDRVVAALLGIAVMVSGCVSDQNALQVQANADLQKAKELCNSENLKTHLERSKCDDDAFRRTVYVHSDNKDLLDELMAERELLSAKIDRHELTQEEANLQMAQGTANLNEQLNRRRQQQQEQQAVNSIAALSLMQQMNPSQQAAPIYQPTVVRPLPTINCTSTPSGTTVYTNCY